MDVEVDDGDALEAELALRMPDRDRDVREDAEPHRLRAQGMVTGRTHEREAAGAQRADRHAAEEAMGADEASEAEAAACV